MLSKNHKNTINRHINLFGSSCNGLVEHEDSGKRKDDDDDADDVCVIIMLKIQRLLIKKTHSVRRAH